MITRLNNNWITEQPLDYEYKKYYLSAYLQYVQQNFKVHKLYPVLSDLVQYFEDVSKIHTEKTKLSDIFPKALEGIDTENFKLNFQQVINDDALMEEIQRIVDFALPAFLHNLEIGKEEYEFVESNIEINHVGLESIEKNYGYLLVSNGNEKQAEAYAYQIGFIESPNTTYRSISTKYLKGYSLSITQTVESVKKSIIKEQGHFNHPAVYYAMSKTEFPFQETVLPIVKRMMMKVLG